MAKELIFSLAKQDFRWDYYKGSGAGGQKRNKTENCCRCTHEASGAVGKSEEGRSKEQNKKKAFRRMAETEEFQKWCRLEAARRSGEHDKILKRVEIAMRHIKVEIQQNGRWVHVDKDDPLSEEPGSVRLRI